MKKIPGAVKLVNLTRVLAGRIYYRLKGEQYIDTVPLSMEELSSLISKNHPVILEIGCNDGTDTKRLRTAFPKATIHCFEPDARAQIRFVNNGGLDICTSLHRTAVGAVDGKVIFNVSSGRENLEMPRGWDLSGSIRKPLSVLTEVPWIKFENQVEVAITTLDLFFEKYELSLVDFIWMDVQGAELDVIRGGAKALKSVRYLYTEYDDGGLYDGGATLLEICRSLPDFTLLKRYAEDALFVNKNLGNKRSNNT